MAYIFKIAFVVRLKQLHWENKYYYNYYAALHCARSYRHINIVHDTRQPVITNRGPSLTFEFSTGNYEMTGFIIRMWIRVNISAFIASCICIFL